IDLKAPSAEQALRIGRSTVWRQVLTSLDHWAQLKNRPEERRDLLAVANLADNDPWRRRLRALGVSGRGQELKDLAGEPGVEDQPAGTLQLLVRRLEESNARDLANKVLERAQQQHPGDFWINEVLALRLQVRGDLAEALRYHQAALATR